MDEEIRVFCQNVKFVREQYKLTLAEMAERLKISEKEVMMLECGVIPEETTAEIVIQIYKCFGISPKAQFEPWEKR